MAEPTQPPPSWNELSTRLAGLLDRLEASCSEEEAKDLGRECAEWRTGAVQAAAAAATHERPSPAEREALTKALLQAGEQLVALDAHPGTMQIMRPACILMLGCSELAQECHMEPDDIRRYTACLALVLHSGTRLLEGIPQRITSAAEDACEPEDVLYMQAFALVGTLELLGDASPATAGSVLPPREFVCWWKAAAGVLEAIERVRGCPGTKNPDVLVACATTVFSVFQGGRSFEAHRDALHREGALCGQLARLLLPCLAATAIGLQLPPARQPPGCTWWRARDVAGALDFLCHAPLADPLLADPSSITRIVQLAAKLAVDAPAAEQLATMLDLLGVAAYLCRLCVLPQRTLAPQQTTQLTRQLLSALPKFALMMPVDETLLEMLPCLEETAKLLTALMDHLTLTQQAACSIGDAQTWCIGAAAALRLLAPLAARCRPSTGPLSDPRVAEKAADASGSVCELARAASTLTSQASKAVAGGTSHQPPAAPAVMAAAYEAVWQLHSMLCRAVHAGAGERETLLNTASGTLLVADRLASSMREAAVPLAAMSVSQFELLRTALLHPSAPAIDADSFDCMMAYGALSTAVAGGPAAIAAHPDTEAMFSHLAPPLAQDEYAPSLMLLKPAIASLPAAAHLLLCGVFDRAVQEARRIHDKPEASALMHVVVPAVKELCHAGEAAAAAASSAAEPSSHALAAALEQPAAALRAALSAPGMARAVAPNLRPRELRSLITTIQSQVLPPARQLAAALLQWWRRPEQAAADALELARVAAARSCAFLRCANLAGEGGPAAGEGAGSSRCSACRAVWYCNETCSHADWRPRDPTGHKAACRQLGAERAAAKAAAAAEQRQAGGGGGASSS